MIIAVSCRGAVYTPPNVEKVTNLFSRIPVDQGYNVSFGNANVAMKNNGSNAVLSLDKKSGELPTKKKKKSLLLSYLSRTYYDLPRVISGGIYRIYLYNFWFSLIFYNRVRNSLKE